MEYISAFPVSLRHKNRAHVLAHYSPEQFLNGEPSLPDNNAVISLLSSMEVFFQAFVGRA